MGRVKLQGLYERKKALNVLLFQTKVKENLNEQCELISLWQFSRQN